MERGREVVGVRGGEERERERERNSDSILKVFNLKLTFFPFSFPSPQYKSTEK